MSVHLSAKLPFNLITIFTTTSSTTFLSTILTTTLTTTLILTNILHHVQKFLHLSSEFATCKLLLFKFGENLLLWPMPILPPSSLNKKCPDVTGRYVATYWYRSHSTFPYHADPDVMQSYASKYLLDIRYGLV